MYRKIMSFLEAWKDSDHRKPLILQGARQVGKTYSILEFGRSCYENVAYFNFETNPKLNETFEENISPDYLIPILSHIAGQTIVKEKTLIVFDEVQLCERALTALKYFCEDAPDYHIVALGSLLGVAVSREKFTDKELQQSSTWLESGEDTEFKELRERQYAALEKAVAALEPQDRFLITAFYEQDRSLAELTQITGMSLSNVKVRLFRCRNRLARILKGNKDLEK